SSMLCRLLFVHNPIAAGRKPSGELCVFPHHHDATARNAVRRQCATGYASAVGSKTLAQRVAHIRVL
ncbi:MAG: hypothetical protein ACK50J_18655, partial [Planctomyces sp.]